MFMSEAVQRAQGLQELGQLDCGPNVAVVRMMGVRLVKGKIPASVRKELNAAIKEGKIGHLKKEGLKPEAYFHPNSKFKAMEDRDREASESIQAISKVVG